MARKRTLSTLDTSIAYEAVGLDLAKEDTAIAAFGPDHEGPYLIDRMPYDKLYELLADMAPTLVAMEPCSGAHQIAEQIQELGHEVMMISGRHVQAWVKDHCNGQKTDLNDAFAILNLAYDRWLRECQDFCVWGGYSRGSPTRLPFVFEMQYARPDAIAGAKVEGPARSAGGSSLAPAIARREAAGALAREV